MLARQSLKHAKLMFYDIVYMVQVRYMGGGSFIIDESMVDNTARCS